MARRKGKPMFAKKTVQGSHFITRVAELKMNAAARRSGKSDSDVIDFGLRVAADLLTREVADAIAGGKTVEEALAAATKASQAPA